MVAVSMVAAVVVPAHQAIKMVVLVIRGLIVLFMVAVAVVAL
jgi:hypothetical protein